VRSRLRIRRGIAAAVAVLAVAGTTTAAAAAPQRTELASAPLPVAAAAATRAPPTSAIQVGPSAPASPSPSASAPGASTPSSGSTFVAPWDIPGLIGQAIDGWFSEAADVWQDNHAPFGAGKRTLTAPAGWAPIAIVAHRLRRQPAGMEQRPGVEDISGEERHDAREEQAERGQPAHTGSEDEIGERAYEHERRVGYPRSQPGFAGRQVAGGGQQEPAVGAGQRPPVQGHGDQRRCPVVVALHRRVGELAPQRLDLHPRHQGEEAQISAGIPIVDVQPELIELVRRCSLRVQPDRARFALPELSDATTQRLQTFLDERRHGDMVWMDSSRERRGSPTKLWQQAQSVVREMGYLSDANAELNAL